MTQNLKLVGRTPLFCARFPAAIRSPRRFSCNSNFALKLGTWKVITSWPIKTKIRACNRWRNPNHGMSWDTDWFKRDLLIGKRTWHEFFLSSTNDCTALVHCSGAHQMQITIRSWKCQYSLVGCSRKTTKRSQRGRYSRWKFAAALLWYGISRSSLNDAYQTAKVRVNAKNIYIDDYFGGNKLSPKFKFQSKTSTGHVHKLPPRKTVFSTSTLPTCFIH